MAGLVDGKAGLVTGSAGGIGRATAIASRARARNVSSPTCPHARRTARRPSG